MIGACVNSGGASMLFGAGAGFGATDAGGNEMTSLQDLPPADEGFFFAAAPGEAGADEGETVRMGGGSGGGNGGGSSSARSLSDRIFITISDLIKRNSSEGDTKGLTALLDDITPLISPRDAGAKPNFWEAALLMGQHFNRNPVALDIRKALVGLIADVQTYQGDRARTSTAPVATIFGTSGWRDRIGEAFSVSNVQKVTRGIIEMMQTPDFLNGNDFFTFEEVKEKGVVVFRDNRFMGRAFMDAAIRELTSAGIRVYDAGETPTGVGSALVTELDAAGSINFTPSHNPMDYAGIKFNPRDGGPAGPEFTNLIEQYANEYMQPDRIFAPADPSQDRLQALVETIDAKEIYNAFLAKSEIFDVGALRTWLTENKEDLSIVVDYMHGSARGYVEAVLGKDVVEQLMASGSIVFLNTEDDTTFHGIKPEPSLANQMPLIERLQEANRKYSLAVFMDPDADRIRFGDKVQDLSMNLFGPMAYASLLDDGFSGAIASTVASSPFGFAIARANDQPVIETKVGFKYLRDGLIKFEESDGISGKGHTLEKDALFGFLMAVRVMMSTGKSLSEYYAELQERYGYFYPTRSGVDVKGVDPSAWKAYKGKVVPVLQNDVVKVGDKLMVGDQERTVTEVVTKDGLKVVLDDRSVLVLRGSGTEPKFRNYVTVASDGSIEDVAAAQAAYAKANAELLDRARELVDGV